MSTSHRSLSSLSFLLLAGTPALASADSDSMSQWRDYAAAAVSPSFDWYTPDLRTPQLDARAELLDAGNTAMVSLAGFQARFAGLSLSSDSDPFAASYTAIDTGSLFSGRAISNQFAGTRLAFRSPLGRELGVTAIVARQQYATLGFGAGEWDGSYADQRRIGLGADTHESATGSGVRFDLGGSLEQGLNWDLALQSRIEMDPFKAYRGVYSEAGDFDLPGFAKLGVEAPIVGGFSLGAELQRVFYREIDTFTSAALPTRFLSLLGDGTSPEFAWQDLTVYALEARYADDFRGRWTFRLASQQQPRPSSALLDRALEELYSDNNVALSYQLDRGALGEFRLAASYSPVTYFLGSSPYLRRGFETGSQLEFEAQWSVAF